MSKVRAWSRPAGEGEGECSGEGVRVRAGVGVRLRARASVRAACYLEQHPQARRRHALAQAADDAAADDDVLHDWSHALAAAGARAALAGVDRALFARDGHVDAAAAGDDRPAGLPREGVDHERRYRGTRG